MPLKYLRSGIGMATSIDIFKNLVVFFGPIIS